MLTQNKNISSSFGAFREFTWGHQGGLHSWVCALLQTQHHKTTAEGVQPRSGKPYLIHITNENAHQEPWVRAKIKFVEPARKTNMPAIHEQKARQRDSIQINFQSTQGYKS